MNKVRNAIPAILVALALGGLGIHSLVSPAGVVHAQGSPPDQSSTFQGTLINTGAAATVVSATTLSSAIGGPAVIVPPGGAAPSARIHLKHIHAMGITAETLQFQEHPVTGSNKVICNMECGISVPSDVKAGNNEVLGLNGFLTAAGSSIVVVSTSTSDVTGITLTYSLE